MKTVSHNAHGLDPGCILPELAAQAPDVSIHSAGRAVELIAPHLVQQLHQVKDVRGILQDRDGRLGHRRLLS